MVEIDGIKYIAKTPSENTADLLKSINTYCSDHNIVNSKGEQVFIEANLANPLYIMLWALGYLTTVIQNLIISVGRAHNVQESSDDQLLNIADMAGIKRGRRSLTTLTIKFVAMTDSNVQYDPSINDGNCVIDTSHIITYNGITYTPALHPSVTLAPGDVGYVTYVADRAGSYNISAGTITALDTPVANCESIYQYASTPGQSQESIASLRERIQRRQISGTTVDAAIDAIRALEGVTLCNIYYNPDVVGYRQLGDDGIIVPARWALILVQGYNQNIAEAYFSNLTAPTVMLDSSGQPDLSNLQGHTDRILDVQYYTTHAQQRIPVLICKPKQKYIYIRVYIGVSVVSSVELAMKQAVADIASDLTAGQSVTSADILAALQAFTAYKLQGAMVSETGEENTFKYQSKQAEDVLWVMNTENIKIVMPEVGN